MGSHSISTSRRSYESKPEESNQAYQLTTPNYINRNDPQHSETNWEAPKHIVVAPKHIKGLTSRGNRTIRL